MKERIRRLGLYSFYDHTGMEKHLERMAADGWLLEKIRSNIWHYRRISPADLRFCVTYFPRASEFDPEPGEGQQLFYDFCTHTGWKLAAASAQLQIFYNENPDPVPIETDPELELDSLNRSMKKGNLPICIVFMAISLLMTALLIHTLRTDPLDFLSDAGSVMASWEWLILFLFCVIEVGGYYRWYRKARKAAARGEFLESASHLWVAKSAIAGALLGFLFWFISEMSAGPFWKRIVIVAVSVYMFGLVTAGGGWIRDFFKRRKVSAGTNRTLTFSFTFFMSLLFLVGLIFIMVPVARREYEKQKEEGLQANLDGSFQELPLAIEDFQEIDSSAYMYETTGDQSLLLERMELRQRPRPSMAAPQEAYEMEYTVTHVKLPALYDFCKKAVFRESDETEDDRVPDGFKKVYEEQEGEFWDAQEVYRLTDQNMGPLNQYLLCYPDQIVELKFYWEPTQAQLKRAAEKLSEGLIF